MIPLSRDICINKQPENELVYNLVPIQLGMGRSPYHVALASILVRYVRSRQVTWGLKKLLTYYPSPETLARATELEYTLRSCGLQRNRARQIQRFACEWLSPNWEDMGELSGVGLYVADAVGLFCFGCTELASSDKILKLYAEKLNVSVTSNLST